MRGHPDPLRRAQAEAMRREGQTYREIGEQLGVATSTLSTWLSGLDLSAAEAAGIDSAQALAISRRARSKHLNSERRTRTMQREALSQIGILSDRDVFLMGLAAYWAEGSKNKPWRTGSQAAFCNSDATMIALFLRFLSVVGVEKPGLGLRGSSCRGRPTKR